LKELLARLDLPQVFVFLLCWIWIH